MTHSKLERILRDPCGQRRIVLDDRPDTNQDGIDRLSELMHFSSCIGSGDPSRFSTSRGDLSIQRHARLEDDVRTSGLDPMNICLVELLCLSACRTDRHHKPGSTELCKSASFDGGIGIDHRHHYPADSGFDDSWGAGRGPFIEVTTGLERDIEGSAFGATTGLMKRENFGVGLSRPVMVSATDDAALRHDKSANHRIRAGLAASLCRETKSHGHEAEVLCGGGHRFLRATRERR